MLAASLNYDADEATAECELRAVALLARGRQLSAALVAPPCQLSRGGAAEEQNKGGPRLVAVYADSALEPSATWTARATAAVGEAPSLALSRRWTL